MTENIITAVKQSILNCDMDGEFHLTEHASSFISFLADLFSFCRFIIRQCDIFKAHLSE